MRTELWIVEFGSLHRAIQELFCRKQQLMFYLLIIKHAISILHTNIVLSSWVSPDITSSFTIFIQHNRLDMNSGIWDPPQCKSNYGGRGKYNKNAQSRICEETSIFKRFSCFNHFSQVFNAVHIPCLKTIN